MKANEIYSALSPELIQQMLNWFRDEDRKVYKTAVASLAAQQKLRPVFIERKPLPEQYAWIHKTLKLKASNGIGEHLLQAWLMGGQKQMLATFCDIMGIEHEEGTVNGELPESMEAGKLDNAVEMLLEEHDPQLVAIYLTCFNQQRPDGWPELTAKLENDERLKLA
ncbi:MAG: hypothetical protein R3242_03280 [Akkermansiaceae bacterium]|nr:hypothetical protein [Akkermansiaceae bacterium]